MTALRYGLIAALIAIAIYAAIQYFGIDPEQTFDSILAYLSMMGTL